MRKLKNRVAIVTGASRGLGPHIARALAGEGVRLVLGARTEGELEAVAQELRANGGKAIAVQSDVASATDRRRLLSAAQAEFGRVDILVNNAGIEMTGHFESLTEEEMARVIEVNLTASMQMAWLVTPVMLEQRAGHVVMVSSLAGKVPMAYSIPYAASKAGMIGFTEGFRSEFRKRGVSASAICPGLVSEAGMYKDMQDQAGVHENFLAGTVTPARVAKDVVKAIKRDRPEMLVYRGPGRVVSALAEATPGVFERVFPLFGTRTLFRKVADARERAPDAEE